MASAPRVFVWFRAALGVSLAVCGVLYVPLTWHWPLVGDASLIHYIAFLIERGWAPYRQLGDMNMPGSFLIELASMHVFGPGALAWRLFDCAVCLCDAGAILAICTRRNWLPALFASSLFVLVHGRDGLAQGGQRDLTMAVCLVAATTCLLSVLRRRSVPAAIILGLLSGVAFTVKPTAALLTVLQAAIVWRALVRNDGSRKRALNYAGLASTGWVVAPGICAVFLVREHAVAAFFAGLRSVVPYYASLGHRSLAYVLSHSISPLEPLVAVWIAVLLLRREPPRRYLDDTHRLLFAGVLFGVANCVLQHRALPYYRYPLLAFLLPLIALDLHTVACSAFGEKRERGGERSGQFPAGNGARQRLAGGVAMVGLGFGALLLAPQSAILIHRYRWYQTDMLDSLQRNLDALGGSALSGRVQCIDSVSGCGTVLYRMRLEPATGILSDFLLFGNTTDAQPPETIPVIRDTRAEFSRAMAAHPATVIVVTSHLHMSGPEHFGKLDGWPALEQMLATRYRMATEWHPARPERWWSREEYPAAYRIYVLRDGANSGSGLP